MKSLLNSENGMCYICGCIGLTHKHHIFGGANRKHSEDYGLFVYLCPKHHNMSDKSVHFDKGLKKWIQTEGQEAFEQIYGHEKFMEIFGKNYKEAE